MSVCVWFIFVLVLPMPHRDFDLYGTHLMQRLIYHAPKPDRSSQNTIFSIFHFYETSEQLPIKIQKKTLHKYLNHHLSYTLTFKKLGSVKYFCVF